MSVRNRLFSSKPVCGGDPDELADRMQDATLRHVLGSCRQIKAGVALTRREEGIGLERLRELPRPNCHSTAAYSHPGQMDLPWGTVAQERTEQGAMMAAGPQGQAPQARAAPAKALPEWVVFHVPHDSAVIPEAVRSQFAVSDAELAGELVTMTDHLTLALFTPGVPDRQIVQAAVSRLVVDVERFEDDCHEPMARRGMGAVYLQTSGGQALRRPLLAAERSALIEAWYRPHHERLAAAVRHCLEQFSQALLIDAHSFASRALAHEDDQQAGRPDICIGTDRFHTPQALQEAFVGSFTAAGFSVAVNAPFAGALVPGPYLRKDARVNAVMVEVNKSLYLDESTGQASGNFAEVSGRIRRCIGVALQAWAAAQADAPARRVARHRQAVVADLPASDVGGNALWQSDAVDDRKLARPHRTNAPGVFKEHQETMNSVVPYSVIPVASPPVPWAGDETPPPFGAHRRLCFYPSSADGVLWALMRLDCDLFVMADKRRQSVSWRRIKAGFEKRELPVELMHRSAQHLCFRSERKTAWIFLEDNNAALRRLALAGLAIHHFVGICDGCAEGGNHECVHERPFLSHVLQLADQAMAYTTDHSRPLEQRPHGWACGTPTHPRFRETLAWCDFPEPPEHQRRLGLEREQPVPTSTQFVLQGVLVAPRRQRDAPVRKADLVVLPIGELATQLDCLSPFRTQLHRGVLAEYRVFR